jgi:hypothetical protein
MAAILKFRGERPDELTRPAARPNGINRVYLILTGSAIPGRTIPIGTIMIAAILDHEFPLRPGAG